MQSSHVYLVLFDHLAKEEPPVMINTVCSMSSCHLSGLTESVNRSMETKLQEIVGTQHSLWLALFHTWLLKATLCGITLKQRTCWCRMYANTSVCCCKMMNCMIHGRNDAQGSRAKYDGWFAYLLSQLIQFSGLFGSVNKHVDGHSLVDFTPQSI